MAIRSSVGANGVNRSDDTRYVQDLLNKQRGTAYSYGQIAVDGQVGSQTIGAIMNYQQKVVGFSSPDGRVDPGYQTIAALEKNAGASIGRTNAPAPPPPPFTQIAVAFRHGGVRPPANGEGMFESTVSIALRGQLHIFTGSIFPDNMTNYGRIKNGTYPIYLGFHGQTGTPSAADLVPKTSGPRMPTLSINRDNAVPIISDSPWIPTSGNLHIHRAAGAGSSIRGSDGCLTIKAVDWVRFIQVILNTYPDFADWHGTNGTYIGRQCGSLEVTG